MRLVNQRGLLADFGVGDALGGLEPFPRVIPLHRTKQHRAAQRGRNLRAGHNQPGKPNALTEAGQRQTQRHASTSQRNNSRGNGPQPDQSAAEDQRDQQHDQGFLPGREALEIVATDEVEQLRGVNLDAGQKALQVFPRVKRAAKFVLPVVDGTDARTRADENNFSPEEIVAHVVGRERLAVTDMRNGQRRTVITNPSLVRGIHRVGGLRRRQMQRTGGGPGERRLLDPGEAGHEAAHGAVVVNAQRGEADARCGLGERLVDRADGTEFEPRMFVVRDDAAFVIVFGGEDHVAVVADGFGQGAVSVGIRPGRAEDDVEHDGFRARSSESAEQFGMEFARPRPGGIKIAFSVGMEVKIDDDHRRVVGGRQIDSAQGVKRIIAGIGEILLQHRAQQSETNQGGGRREQPSGRQSGSFHLRLCHV